MLLVTSDGVSLVAAFIAALTASTLP